MPTYQLRLLGSTEILDETGQPVPLPAGKPLALLIYLLVSGRAETRESLAYLLWPRSEPERAKHSVRQALWLLRTTFGPDAITANHDVAVAAEYFTTDVAAFETALADCRMEELSALWRGAFLERFAIPDAPEWERWADDVRVRLERRFAQCLQQQALEVRQQGDPKTARQYLRRAIAVYPQTSEPWATLFELLLETRDLDGAAALLAEAERIPAETRPDIDLPALQSRLESVRTELAASRETRSFQVEFVGRTREYADLVALWRQARAGETRLGLVLGPTGIGKTRLATEVGRAAGVDGAVLVEVKAREAERPIEGALLAELVEKLIVLRGAAGISGGSERVLHALLPQKASKQEAEVHPGVASTVSDAVADLLDAIAEETPLVVVIDDLQWADPPSRSMLARALRRTRGAACLFLLTCRTDDSAPETHRLLTTLQEETAASTVQLEPLTLEETREMVTLLVAFPDRESADEVVTRLHALTDGNPLFLVELLETLQEQNVLEWADGGWRLDPGRMPGEFPLPRSLAAVVEERLSRLSEPAASVAQRLAMSAAALAVEDVRLGAGLTEGRLVHALDELLARGLVRWRDGDRIEFAHDQYRVAARRWRQPALRGVSGSVHRKRWWYVAAPAAAVVLLLLAFRGRLLPASSTGAPAPPAYGGGAIWVWPDNAPPTLLRPGPNGGWRTAGALAWHPSSAVNVYGPFRTTAGHLVWFRMELSDREPPYITRLDPEGARVLVRTPGDDNVVGISPDDQYLLYRSEDLQAATYTPDLYVARADGTQPRRILRGPAGQAAWSPNGAMIAAVRRGQRDTLYVLTPSGFILEHASAHEIVLARWCGDSRNIVMRAREQGDYRLAVFDTDTRRMRWVDTPGSLLGELACSPDGTAVAADVSISGEAKSILLSLDSDSMTILPVPALGVRLTGTLFWVPDTLAPIVQAVRIVGPKHLSLQWGQQTRLQAKIVPEGAGLAPDSVTWTSLDPGIVSAGPGGVLWGSGPGRTKVVAAVRDWHADTLQVEVSGTPSTTALLKDVFDQPLDDRWYVIGWPLARSARLDGAPVLELRGDGMHTDGIISREAFDLSRGATLELDFRFNLSRNSEQRIGACFYQTDPPADSTTSSILTWTRGEAVCAAYPGGELDKFDAAEFMFSTVGIRFITVPGLPTTNWIHLEMDVRADGTATLYVNQRYVGEAPARVRDPGARPWRVRVVGAAVGTRMYVRNLVVWPGTRDHSPPEMNSPNRDDGN